MEFLVKLGADDVFLHGIQPVGNWDRFNKAMRGSMREGQAQPSVTHSAGTGTSNR